MDSMLAVVDSKEKQIAIARKAKLNRRRYWIGLYRDPRDTSSWLWVDSSRLCNGCGHWGAGQTNNVGESQGCGAMNLFFDSGLLNDQRCWSKNRYICQKKGWYFSYVDKIVTRFNLKYDYENYFIVLNWLWAGSRVRNFLSDRIND